MGVSPRARVLARAAAQVLLAFLILFAAVAMMDGPLIQHLHQVFYDFRGGLYNAGIAILHGHSPYRAGFLSRQAALMRTGHVALGESALKPFSVPVYPALANVLVVPLALLPFWLAGVLYAALSLVAMVVGVRLLGVRDWRCHGLVLVSWPFMFGLFLGAIGPFLVLGAGAAWRWREQIWRPAVAIATLVAVKVFPWTLALWLLITGRRRAFAAALLVGLVLTFGAWALIDFHGLVQYPQMLSNLSILQENRAVSVVGVLAIAGVPAGVASAIGLGLAGAILLGAWRLSRGPDGDRRAFGLAVLAALTGTPIVWEHYMVLLFVPVALVSPRLSRAWLIPLLPPVANTLSWIVIPGQAKFGAFSPEMLRTTLPWLLAEVVLGVALCTTAEQRRRLWARLPRVQRAGVARLARTA